MFGNWKVCGNNYRALPLVLKATMASFGVRMGMGSLTKLADIEYFDTQLIQLETEPMDTRIYDEQRT